MAKSYYPSLKSMIILIELKSDYEFSIARLVSSFRFRLNADVQKKVLITQLKLAIELDLPLVIHCRDADDDCLEILTQVSQIMIVLYFGQVAFMAMIGLKSPQTW